MHKQNLIAGSVFSGLSIANNLATEVHFNLATEVHFLLQFGFPLITFVLGYFLPHLTYFWNWNYLQQKRSIKKFHKDLGIKIEKHKIAKEAFRIINLSREEINKGNVYKLYYEKDECKSDLICDCGQKKV